MLTPRDAKQINLQRSTCVRAAFAAAFFAFATAFSAALSAFACAFASTVVPSPPPLLDMLLPTRGP